MKINSLNGQEAWREAGNLTQGPGYLQLFNTFMGGALILVALYLVALQLSILPC